MSTALRRDFVRFSKIAKSYDGRTKVVDGLDLDVVEGEFLTLLGPSGSGKTTCLMMLAGFEAPDAGDILVAGQSITRDPPHKRNIGVVFQNYALFPHMTVAENLAFPLRQRGMDRAAIATKVTAALAKVHLTDFAARHPAQLSGGQQQRVALARALVFEPRLVLMDEPLGALDRRLRESMQLEIKRIHAQIGMTAVYVTHDQSEALTMSDRIAVFNRGRIEQIASPTEIYERPATPFVARFVGENNSLYGRVEAGESGRRILLDGGIPILAEPGAGLQPGDRALITLRPELIAIAPQAPIDNRVDVTVRDVVYNGDHVLVPCQLGPREILLKAPSAGFGKYDVRAGATLAIGWQAAASRVFAAPAGEA